MGEYAEYMLNGDDCQYCGEYLGEGDGYPRSCRSCASEMKTGADYDYKKKPVSNQAIGKKLRRALGYCHGMDGMYPGCHWDLAPAMFEKLKKWGFVESYHPHNHMHKVRAILTQAGEQAYKDVKDKKPVYIPVRSK